MEERRRAPRVPAKFWVEVEGIDADPVLVSGDISTTGICFERPIGIAEVGVVEKLAICSQDGKIQVRVLAQHIRTFVANDKITGAKRPMVAFAFLPDSGELIGKIRKLVQQIVQENAAQKTLVVDHRFDVDLSGKAGGAQAATVFRLEVSRMRIQTSWPIAVGDKVQVVFQSFAGGERIPFEGIATQVMKNPAGGYEADVELAVAGVRTAFPVSTATMHGSITDSIDLIFDTGDISDRTNPKNDLVGRLERIPLGALLSLFEVERMSGELRLNSKNTSYTLYWSSGQLLDIEPAGPGGSVRGVLADLMKWQAGNFRFIRKEIKREDKVQMPMAALLLDLAREADELDR